VMSDPVRPDVFPSDEPITESIPRIAGSAAANPGRDGAPATDGGVADGVYLSNGEAPTAAAGDTKGGVTDGAKTFATNGSKTSSNGAKAGGSGGRKTKSRWPFWVELPVLIIIAFVLTFLIQTFIARVYYVPSGSMEQTLHGSTSGGDRILAFKLVYDFHDPRQGDVVVFKGPDTWAPEADIPGPSSWLGKVGQSLGSVIGIAPPNEKDFVKRVIAVGGQTVQCCDAQGRVQVDGVSLNEPYIYEPIDAVAWEQGTVSCKPKDADNYDSQRCFAPFKVPQGEIWVMGDHRSDSSDSSYYCLGLTPAGAKQYQDSRADHAACGRPIPVDDVIGKAVFIVMPPSRWGTIGSPDIMPSAAGVSVGALTVLPSIAPATLGIFGAAGLGWATRRVRRVRGRGGRA
jgi:signal peptidase I